jgi:hypothetical protein
MSVESQIKKALNDIVNKSIKSKELVSTIIIGENDNKPKSEIENVEIDLPLLESNIKSQFKNLLKILEENKINTDNIKYKTQCILSNYEQLDNIVNNIYNCLFKEAIDNNNILNKLFNLLKNNWKITSATVIILILIYFIYYKIIRKST